jgi:hypothetical protein
VTPTELGTLELTAEYAGDADFQASASESVPHEVTDVGGIDPGSVSAFVRLALPPTRPHPARGLTQLIVELPASAPVTLSVYDTRGRLVSEILKGEWLPAGRTTREWRPIDLPAGVYLLRARAGRDEVRRKCIWLGN